mmetsp:Transcript_71161/g.212222  ORF Transcript_71161/g.212222 Transcript_71161/m.212222 type:complete len:286 (-) Transcript_71161:739-1596(-)
MRAPRGARPAWSERLGLGSSLPSCAGRLGHGRLELREAREWAARRAFLHQRVVLLQRGGMPGPVALELLLEPLASSLCHLLCLACSPEPFHRTKEAVGGAAPRGLRRDSGPCGPLLHNAETVAKLAGLLRTPCRFRRECLHPRLCRVRGILRGVQRAAGCLEAHRAAVQAAVDGGEALREVPTERVRLCKKGRLDRRGDPAREVAALPGLPLLQVPQRCTCQLEVLGRGNQLVPHRLEPLVGLVLLSPQVRRGLLLAADLRTEGADLVGQGLPRGRELPDRCRQC